MKQDQTIFSSIQLADIQLIQKKLWHQLGNLREPIGNEKERKFSLSGKEILEQKASYVGCLGIAKAFLYLASHKKSIQARGLITTSIKSYKQYLKNTRKPFEGHVIIAILGNNGQYMQ